jgi:hypothetical protein
VWPVGESQALLTEAQWLAIAADPEYRVGLSNTNDDSGTGMEPDAVDGQPEQDAPAPVAAPIRKPKPKPKA